MEKITPFKELTFKKKLEYIWDYYRIHIFVAICVIGVAGSFIHHYMTMKETLLSITMVNCPYKEEDDDVLQASMLDDFFQAGGYDASQQEITLDHSYFINFQEMDGTSMQTMSALQVIIAAQSANIIMIDEDGFNYLGEQSTFLDVSTILDEDIMDRYVDDIVYVTDKQSGVTYPAGIHLTTENSSWLAESGAYEDCYIGLCSTNDHSEIQKEFINYVLADD